MNAPPSKKRMAVVATILMLAIAGIGYLRYRESVTPIPEFESLKRIAADGMKYEVTRPGEQIAFEFTDNSGNRFQTDYIAAEAEKPIEDALNAGGVALFVGRWNGVFESKTIFTVYHMTRGDHVLLDYTRMAEWKKKQQANAIPAVIIVTILGVGVLIFVLWLTFKRRADADAWE